MKRVPTISMFKSTNDTHCQVKVERKNIADARRKNTLKRKHSMKSADDNREHSMKSGVDSKRKDMSKRKHLSLMWLPVSTPAPTTTSTNNSTPDTLSNYAHVNHK